MKIKIIEQTDNSLILKCSHWILIKHPFNNLKSIKKSITKNWLLIFVLTVSNLFIFPGMIIFWLLIVSFYLVYFSVKESEKITIEVNKTQNLLLLSYTNILNNTRSEEYKLSDIKTIIITNHTNQFPIIITNSDRVIKLPNKLLGELLHKFLINSNC